MRCSSVLAAAALACTLVVPKTHAQFRPRLPKGVIPSAAEKAANPGNSAAAPEFNDRNLEITDARLDQVLKGLAAADQERQRREERQAQAAAREKALEDHRAKKDKWDACAQSAAQGDPSAQADLQKRIEAAQAKGDMQELQRITDSVMKAMQAAGGPAGMQAAQQKQIATKCGPEPQKPADDARGADPRALMLQASGLTAEQWDLMRERLYVLATMKKDDLAKPVPGYTATETSAVARRYDEVHKYQAQILSY
jgi:hypothetical protein